MSSSEVDPATSADEAQPADGATHQQPAHATFGTETGYSFPQGVAPESATPAPAPQATGLIRKAGDYVIESDVPMPDFKSQASRGRYPFGEMKVGESVVIRGVKEKTLDGARRSWLLRRGVDLQKVRVEGGFRVFRVA